MARKKSQRGGRASAAAIKRAREQVQDLNLPDTGNFAPLANQQPRPVAPGMGTGEQLLAAIEREKALGLRSS